MPYLKNGATEIYYEVHGDGPPFLFCSVTGLDHQAWKFHQVREFSRDHKVIVFDYRGTGKSSKTVQRYSIKMFTDDAAALLDHLGLEQAIVCGHSMGGVVAQLLALDHPNKVKKLILASSGSSHPGAKGIPLAMCRDMVRIGYEGYIRQQTIETAWTKEFVAAHPDLIESFSKSGCPASRRWRTIFILCWRAKNMTTRTDEGDSGADFGSGRRR
jgi:pimeloyl-ACP methyl ester carboxylesterase